MANTIIQLKHSTVQGNVPVSLANGEISINTRDGKLFYADPTGTVQEFSGFPGPSGLNQEVQFNDLGVLGSDSGLTYNKTTDILTVVGGAIIGGVNVTPQIQLAFTHANAAYNAANGAVAVNLTQNNSITAAFTAANSAGNYANAAFIQANAAYTRANNSLNANTGGIVTGTITADSFITTGSYGNIQGANLIYANTFIANSGGYIQFADGTKQYTANSGSGGATITVAANPPASGNVSGDIWIDSDTGNQFTWFSDGDSYQWVELGPVGQKGDITFAYNQANAAFIVANASFIQANAAFNAANNATDTYVRAHANSAFHQANAAYAQANTNAGNITVIQGVNDTQNTSISNIQGVDTTQNNRITYAENHANAAFLAANNATDTYVRNHANSAFHQANAAYAQALSLIHI